MKFGLNFPPQIDALAVRVHAMAVAVVQSWYKQHKADGTHGAISVTGLTFHGETQTTVGAAGGATAQPATPLGYFLITLSDGTTVAVPYHNAS